ncbi:MAG: leucine-rich repeat domain-containing protein [Holosporales bacterium]|jgi:hypothetical protein|nr:leucine-rich repeat domain-containing protein [Holosporales bacterium]
MIRNFLMVLLATSPVLGAYYTCVTEANGNTDGVSVTPRSLRHKSSTTAVDTSTQAQSGEPGGISPDINDKEFYKYRESSVEIPKGVKKIGKEAFADSRALKQVTFQAGSRLREIGERAFYGCKNLKGIELLPGIQFIGERAFYGCKNLKGIEFPEGVQIIGDNAFGGCERLEKVSIPASIQAIGAGAFDGCCQLKSVHIPKGVQSIGNSTFARCLSLKSVDIPASMCEIGEKAFNGCLFLQTINFAPRSRLATIESWAFASCALSQIKFSARVELIGDHAFSSCVNLCNVDFSECKRLKKIGTAAFGNCRKLKEVVLSATVQEIGSCAFSGIDGVSITCPQGSLQSLYDNNGQCNDDVVLDLLTHLFPVSTKAATGVGNEVTLISPRGKTIVCKCVGVNGSNLQWECSRNGAEPYILQHSPSYEYVHRDAFLGSLLGGSATQRSTAGLNKKIGSFRD